MITPPKQAVFTVCSANYLPKAVALGLSLLEHNPDCDFIIVIVDAKRDIVLRDPRMRYLWIEDLSFPGYRSCAFKYNVIELNTCVKPWVAQGLLRDYQKVAYLDPDVCVFGSLSPIFDRLDRSAALFTPHATTPYSGAGRPTDQDLLRFGSLNLGFFAVSRTPGAEALLKWWHERCTTLCFYEPTQGLGVDQKWMDLALSFFDSVELVKDLGCNVAFWNLHERSLSQKGRAWFVNGDRPLVFVHFSSFVDSDRMVVADKQSRHPPGSRPDFSLVGDAYRAYLLSAAKLIEADSRYGYAEFSNHRRISPTLRRIYALLLESRFSGCADPFDAAGPVHAFARRHRLFSAAEADMRHRNFKESEKLGSIRRMIALLFRLGLWVLGPDRYFLLMRYLGHYSSILSQSDMFMRDGK